MAQPAYISSRNLLLLAVILIVVSIGSIFSKYIRSKSSQQDPFQSVEQNINANKDYILNVIGLMNQHYPLVPDDVNMYGWQDTNANSPLKLEDMGNLNSEFQLKFIQQLQDAEITNLQKRLKSLPIKNDNPAEPSGVKHLQSGRLFETIKHPRQIGSQFSVMVDKQNGTCIKRVPDADIEDNVDLTACDYNVNAVGQKFLLETVNNNQDFNNMLNPDDAPDIYNKYRVDNLFGYGTYPFSVIKTANLYKAGNVYKAGTECITLDSNGLSVEPCTGKESQRFSVFTND